MSIQQFCLRWNNHQPNFISVFTTLLNSESLVDVTLAAEGRHLQAHRVVLSACSSYFQTLFSVNPCQHPIVILKDVKYNDLKTMVDFMYYGEVNVSQEQLPAILKTAEMLKIKGLADVPEQNITTMGHLTKSVSVSSDKVDLPIIGDSTWGSEMGRRSQSPTSPTMRRKRLRKSSTGSGSTEQTSEELSSEITLIASPNPVKPELAPATPSLESIRSETSLRNSMHDPSTDSEPREGSQDSVDNDPLTLVGPRDGRQLSLQISHDSSTSGMDAPVEDPGPEPSTSHQAHASQGVWVDVDEVSLSAPAHRWRQSVVINPSRARFVNTPRGRKLNIFNKEVPENMLRAMRAVWLDHFSINKAANMFEVSSTTLWRYIGMLPKCLDKQQLQDFVMYEVPGERKASSQNFTYLDVQI